MSRVLKINLILGIVICGIVGIAFYSFMQIVFIGHKDPKIVEENLKRLNNTLLSAEFRNGTDYCKIDLLDSINIEINVGNNSDGTILNEKYKILKDTIVVIGGIKHASKYLNSNKFLIQNSKILFKIDNTGSFDTITVMTIKFNKIKLFNLFKKNNGVTSQYKFQDPGNTACFVCEHVFKGQKTILTVTHDQDGSWQFLCGEYDHEEAKPKVISLKEATEIDNSINELYEMPMGVGADRKSMNSKWEPYKLQEE